MRLLLDSQVVLLRITRPDDLPSAIDLAIDDPATEVAISAASFWELAVKEASGKLRLAPDALDAVLDTEFALLDITPQDGIDAARLPRHHGDPFDRILIAQARSRGYTLVGADARFADYDVDVLWD